jgi:hypothetical protein
MARLAMARPRSLLIGLLLATAAGCNVGNDVGNNGQYAFLPRANVDDLAPYPLQHLLVVEDDAETGRAYVYLFAGELPKAAVGLQDLRRIALNYGNYQMAFDPPRARYADERAQARGEPLLLKLDAPTPTDDEDGGADDEDAGTEPGIPPGRRTIELARLDDTGLGQSGASRWLSSVASDDYDVRVYFAAIERSGALPAFTVKDGATRISFDPQLKTPRLDVTIEDDLLELDYGELAGAADSLTIDLWQQIKAKEEPHAAVEAEVRTLLPPGAKYAASKSLVTDAAGKGCWSDEQALGVRIAQLARRYDEENGGLATVHLKLDAVWLEPEQWTVLLDKPTFADYCDDYER